MKAWKITGEGKVVLEEASAQQVEDTCVKLKMLTSLIDTAEVRLYRNGGDALPLVMGRQGVGLVAETGKDVVGVKRGDVVYIRPVSTCGECGNCKSGKKSACERSYTYGKTVDGVMSDFVVVPQSDVIQLPSRVPAEAGVFIETVALAVTALDKLKIEKGEHLVIIGATTVGLALAQAALYYQAVPILVDKRAERLALAEKLGIYYTINSDSCDPVKKIFSITCGKMAETMAYTLLSGGDIQRSFDCLSVCGRAAFVGFDDIDGKLYLDFMPLLKKSISVESVSSADDNYMSAINMLASKAVDVTPFIEKRVAFEDVGSALKEIAENVTAQIAAVVDFEKI